MMTTGKLPQNTANFGFATLADWLSLAAAPTFAIMALLTGVLGGEAPNMLCAAGHSMSPLNGMAAMYLLMSAFHLGPWLRLVSTFRSSCYISAHAFHELRKVMGTSKSMILVVRF